MYFLHADFIAMFPHCVKRVSPGSLAHCPGYRDLRGQAITWRSQMSTTRVNVTDNYGEDSSLITNHLEFLSIVKRARKS